MAKTFFENFKANMDAVGSPCPTSLFATVKDATATATMLVGLVSKFGTKVTLMEVVNAGGASGTPGGLATATGVGELLSVAGGLVASLYLGTVIGSLVVAVDKTYMGDNGDKLTTNLADLYYKADQVMKGGIPKWLKDIMERQTATQSGAAKVPSQKKGSHHLKNPI